MWFVAGLGSNSRLLTTTFRLFDKQSEAEAYANTGADVGDGESLHVMCYYFSNPGEKWVKKWQYLAEEYKNGQYVLLNCANFTP